MSSASLNAYIYEITVMKAPGKNGQMVVGLSDFHDKLHPSNTHQRASLLSLLNAIEHKNAYKLLIEDLSSINAQGAFGCQSYALVSKQGILAGLTQECKALGLDVENLEYRFSRVIALGPLLHEQYANPFQFQPACSIRIDTLISEVEAMIDYLKHSITEKNLSAWYKTCSRAVLTSMRRLGLYSCKHMSCAAFIHANTTSNTRLTFLKGLLTFDSTLLDCAFVNALTRAASQSHVIIVAGGTHIKKTCEQLNRMGYSHVYASELRMMPVDNGITTQLSTANSKQLKKPEPISLDMLSQYIH